MKIKIKLNEITEAFGLSNFKATEFEFLNEYLQCHQPIAEALDKLQSLQSENNFFYGELIPILLRIIKNLQKL